MSEIHLGRFQTCSKSTFQNYIREICLKYSCFFSLWGVLYDQFFNQSLQPILWPNHRLYPPIQFGQEITSQQFWEPAKVILSKWPIKSVEPVRQSVEHVRQSVVTFRQSDRLAYRFDKSHWSWSVWLEKNSLALDKMTWTESWKESSTKEEPGSDRSPQTVFKC